MPDPAVNQSARRWNGLPLPNPDPLTSVSAATRGPMLALPLNDWIDGCHMVAVTEFAWRARPVSPRAPGGPATLGSFSLEKTREPSVSPEPPRLVFPFE